MNTKTTFFTVMLMGAFLSTQSQTSTNSTQGSNPNIPTGYAIAISIGEATPLGPFSDFAETGLNLNLSSQIPISHSHFGIAIMLGGQTNGYNTQAFVNDNGFSSATANDIVSDNLLVGGFATIPVHRFSFDFRLMFGSMICEYPNITAYDYSGNSYQFTFPTAKVFSYDLGAGVRYNLSRKLTLMLNWNYVSGSNATFNGTFVFDNTLSEPFTLTKQFSEFTAAWGLGWIL